MNYTIVIKRNLCQSAATCAAIAPNIYQLDDEFKAIVDKEKHEANSEDWSYNITADSNKLKQIIAGAEACPYNAIEVYDESGKKIYPKK